jgi:hypothetical protein
MLKELALKKAGSTTVPARVNQSIEYIVKDQVVCSGMAKMDYNWWSSKMSMYVIIARQDVHHSHVLIKKELVLHLKKKK